MKFQYLVLILFVSLFAFGCEKSADTIANNKEETLSGAWELRQTSGNTTINYAKDNGNILQLDQNVYKVYEGLKNVASGSFSTAADSTASSSTGLIIPTNHFENRIIFGDFDTKVFYQISNDTLSLLQGYFPLDSGLRSTYVRVK